MSAPRKDFDWPPGKPGCREFQGQRTHDGYGIRWIPDADRPSGRRRVYLHRWVWEQVNGPVPEGQEVRHTCDNPPCFLFAHLLVGTRADNVADMMSRGRGAGQLEPGHENWRGRPRDEAGRFLPWA